ncbi:hypothetical protein HKBW3S03_01826, partial [Candidatus Hakubella thermalkaliphila]
EVYVVQENFTYLLRIMEQSLGSLAISRYQV